ncbi:MAG: M28 family peptidase [Myxococcota bacterium]
MSFKIRRLRLLLLLGILALAGSARAQSISSLVAQVTQANLLAHVTALEGVRFTAAQRQAARTYIKGQLESFGYTVSEVSFPNPQVGLNGDPTGVNLVVRIPGQTTPGDVIILGAHYDTVPGSPGADDNASGVAGVLETARILKGASFDASIELVLYDLEELGLIGSADHAAGVTDNILEALVYDMIGFFCTVPGCQTPLAPFVGCVSVSNPTINVGDGIGLLSNTASQIASVQADAATYVPTLKSEWAQVLDGNGACDFTGTVRRSDHARYWDLGEIAMLLTDTADLRNPNYHLATDTLATLDFTFATDVTRATLAHVAEKAGLIVGVDTDGDGVLDDGDASGTVGDLPCTGGSVSGCDDNCRFRPNPAQEDHGGQAGAIPDGIGDACQCGDNNGDGIVNITDRVLLARSLGGLPPGVDPDKCNVSGTDPTLCNVTDDVVMQRFLGGLPPGIANLCSAFVGP